MVGGQRLPGCQWLCLPGRPRQNVRCQNVRASDSNLFSLSTGGIYRITSSRRLPCLRMVASEKAKYNVSIIMAASSLAEVSVADVHEALYK